MIALSPRICFVGTGIRVIPVTIESGARSESPKVFETAVFGGMIAATFLSLAVVPMLYYVVQTLVERVGGRKLN